MKLDDATLDQNKAADPRVSTWLSANAGSGKTRVLTDRVARLLLAGADAQNILCLTYTKAAAGEMQNRLFEGLGNWAMLPADALRANLERIGEVPPDDLSHARTLFARAVEAPGGLKIQTIHSFCSSLLRQFPLEAGVAPGFRELDEAGQKQVIERVLDDLISEDVDFAAPIARIFAGESLVSLAKSIAQCRSDFSHPRTSDEVLGSLGLTEKDTGDTAIRSLVPHLRGGWWPALLDTLAGQTPAYQRDAALLAEIDPDDPSEDGFAILCKIFLYAKSTRPKTDTYPTASHKNAVEATEPWRSEINALALAVSQALETIHALNTAEQTLILESFSHRFLDAYEKEKQRAGVLDFDDLIHHAKALLTDRSLAWVLYRLDGRIDHILVDEAQDTSPEQWSVIGALAEELAAGEGADRVQDRTFFVVGDKKQSIYSFQGADAQAFDLMADHFASQMTAGLSRRELLFSFRSSPAILDVVDATFETGSEVALGTGVTHRAFHQDKPGRVDLWPLQERKSPEDPPAWYDPVDRVSDGDPAVILADRLAGQIDEMIKTGTIQEKNGQNRPISPGDILILVQRRSTLFDQIIRACKQRGLPMAGADRLKINAALAVKDLTALLSFMALPEDDLSLAAALKSPLFGWSEQELFSLAARRDGAYLWQRLRDQRDTHPETVAALDYLRSRADFERPYELLETILGRFHGRRKLTERLGPEAEDGIDELLLHALRYEQSAVSNLTGFLAQLSAEELDIKRAADTSDDLIRVMTIHGAKGLEAPIVILPDTIRQAPTKSEDFVIPKGEGPLWNAPAAIAPRQVAEAKEEEAEATADERKRLLYVAMTRAESWLIIAGVKPGRATKLLQWHDMVAEGLEKAGAVWLGEGEDRILRYERGAWPEASPAARTDTERANTDVGAPPPFGIIPAIPQIVETVAPSDLGGAKALAGEGGLDEEAAMARGSAIHALLEHFPSHERSAWPRVAARLLPGSSESELTRNLNEAAKTIEAHPQIFGPDTLAEVDVSAHLTPLGKHLVGTIDRIILSDTGVRVVDYKTNAVRPETASETPEGVLRQLGAYLEAVRAIWPDREVLLSILWTVDATLMDVPHDLVTDALARAARP